MCMKVLDLFMKFIPEEKFEITTTLSNDEIMKKLNSIIETNKSEEYYIFKRTEKLFVGYFTEKYFHAFTPMQIMRKYRPLIIEIEGSIIELENNNYHINFSINADTILQLPIILSIMLTILSIVLALLNIALYNPLFYLSCFIAIISFLYYFINYLFYRQKVKESKRRILSLFQTKIYFSSNYN